MASNQYLVELVAVDQAGQISQIWPYIQVEDHYYPRQSSIRSSQSSWQYYYMQTTHNNPRLSSTTPIIKVAGYNQSRLGADGGGIFNIIAWIEDPQGLTNIDKVLVMYESNIFLELLDDGLSGDFNPDDGLYGFLYHFAENELLGFNGTYLFEIVAFDKDGHMSNIWPYLTVRY